MKPTVDYSSDSESSQEEELLRSGQWTKEEMVFASRLIDEFLKGALPNNVPNGTSMRGFLAFKLSCAPKRISKKYESHPPVTGNRSAPASAPAPLTSTSTSTAATSNSTANNNYNGRLPYKHNHSLSAETCVRTRLQLEALEKTFHASLERAEETKKKKAQALAHKKAAAASNKRPAAIKLEYAQTKKARTSGDLPCRQASANLAVAPTPTAVPPVASRNASAHASQSDNANYLLTLLASQGLVQQQAQQVTPVTTGTNLNELLLQRIVAGAAAQESARQQQQAAAAAAVHHELLLRQVMTASDSASAGAIQHQALRSRPNDAAALNELLLKRMLNGGATGIPQQPQRSANNVFHELMAARILELGGLPAQAAVAQRPQAAAAAAAAPARSILSRPFMNAQPSATRASKPTGMGDLVANELLSNRTNTSFADSLVASVTARSSGPARPAGASRKK